MITDSPRLRILTIIRNSSYCFTHSLKSFTQKIATVNKLTMKKKTAREEEKLQRIEKKMEKKKKQGAK